MEKAIVEDVQIDGMAYIDGTQVAATVEQPIVTARVVVISDGKVLKTRATRMFKAKNVPVDDDLYREVIAAARRKFDVYPSAYANGWVVQEYKRRGGTYRVQKNDDGEMMGNYPLSDRQRAMYEVYEELVESLGQFDKSDGGNGAHYMGPLDNPFSSEGMACANCVAYCGGRACEWVSGDIDPLGLCKLWVISDALLGTREPIVVSEEDMGIEVEEADEEDEAEVEKADTFAPPAAVQANAKRAVQWIEEGKAGDGFTAVGAGRARDLASGKAVSFDTVKRIANFLSRHGVDKKAEGFSQGEKGYPSAGRVAWDAWGGDEAIGWAAKIMRERDEMQKARVLKNMDEQRFTLAPWYIPNKYDAQNEWTDPQELQKALWDYVKSGNREIKLQHQESIRAGEWVEALTLPYEWTVPVRKTATEQAPVTYPAGTVLLGVVWEPWAWELVKKGAITGFSIGGSAERLDVPMPSAPQELTTV